MLRPPGTNSPKARPADLHDGHSRYSHDRGDNEREREAGPRSGLLVVGRMQLLLCGHEWEVWVMDSSERVIRKAQSRGGGKECDEKEEEEEGERN